jgi:putative FmdB family regulatory protein
MPTYNYKCQCCSHEFEEHRKIDQRMIEICPNCGKIGNVKIVIKTTPRVVREHGEVHSKTDSAFRDNLKRIKKHHPRNSIKVI